MQFLPIFLALVLAFIAAPAMAQPGGGGDCGGAGLSSSEEVWVAPYDPHRQTSQLSEFDTAGPAA